MPCVKFYHPERTAGQLLQLCTGEECVCAEGKHVQQGKATDLDFKKLFLETEKKCGDNLCCALCPVLFFN